MQHVIDTFEASSFLDCYQTVWFLNHADNGMIAGWRGTEATGINLCKIVTNGAEYDPLLHFTQSIDQAFEISVRRAHDVKCQTLRRLVTDTRQPFQFVNELCNRFSVLKHC